jgi:hypothetical protein
VLFYRVPSADAIAGTRASEGAATSLASGAQPRAGLSGTVASFAAVNATGGIIDGGQASIWRLPCARA